MKMNEIDKGKRKNKTEEKPKSIEVLWHIGGKSFIEKFQ